PSLQTVAVSRTDPGAPAGPILLAGTGELNNERIGAPGLVGLYRSVDGGKTWSVADGGPDATVFKSHDTNQIIAVDADRILLATRVGLYFSKDGGRSFGDGADHTNGQAMLPGPVDIVVLQGTEVTAAVGGEPTAEPEPPPPDLDWQKVRGSVEPGIY